MALFLMQTRVSPDALSQPKSFETLGRDVAEQIREQCPQVRWIASYAVLGPCDYVDVFEAPGIEDATRVSALVRSHGRADSQIWPALAWPEFKSLVRALPDQR